MNFIQKSSLEKFVERNNFIDQQVAEAAIAGDDSEIREAIDKRRVLRALLLRELVASKNNESAKITEAHRTHPEISEFISLWTKRVQKIQFSPEMLENADYCDLFIDAYTPETWDWANETLIITSLKSDVLLRAFVKRGQKNIILHLPTDTLPWSTIINELNDSIRCTNSPRELKACLAKVRARTRTITKIYCDPFSKNHQKITEEVDEAIKFGLKDAQININTNQYRAGDWAANIIQNMPSMARTYNFSNMSVKGTTTAVVVAPGPSLEKNLHLLRDIQSKVFIIAPLRSHHILQKFGIDPDLVVQVDSLKETDAKHFRQHLPKGIKNLFLEAFVNPVFFEIDTQKTIWTMNHKFNEIHKVFNSEPNPRIAPSVAMYCLQICVTLGLRNICLIGQDLASNGKDVYAAGATESLKSVGINSSAADIKEFVIPVKGFWGDTVYTRADYKVYLEQYELLAQNFSDDNMEIELTNATEGGAFINGFEHMSFKNYIEQNREQIHKNDKVIDFGTSNENFNISYEEFRKSFTADLDRIIALSGKIIDIDRNPATNKKGQKKQKTLIDQVQLINKKNQLFELALQNEISDVVGNSAKTQSIPTYAEFFSSVITVAKRMKKAAAFCPDKKN
jgi:hypothetical protein